MNRLLIYNIGTLATPLGNAAKCGDEQGRIKLMQNAWVLAEDGLIKACGKGASPDFDDAEKIDADGALVTPGLIDAHTHLVFGGWRQNELALKLRDVPYLEILKQGGGIISSVKATRAASPKELEEKAEKVLDDMLGFGVTTVEAKSGYGLDIETELRQMNVVKSLNKRLAIDLVSTYMGAHALPPEYKEDRQGYIDLICNGMIPMVARETLAEFCDIFCEDAVFTAGESRVILECAKEHDLGLKIHADEIYDIGGTAIAGELHAASAEHLIKCTDEGIKALADGGTVACLLPATSLYLGADFAPARKMINAGVPVALATDFNPGSCPSSNIQLVINLACLKYRMTPEEVLTGVTLNAAAAIGRAEKAGTIEEGKAADLVIWDAPDLNYICYRMGSNLARTVIKNGKPVAGKF